MAKLSNKTSTGVQLAAAAALCSVIPMTMPIMCTDPTTDCINIQTISNSYVSPAVPRTNPQVCSVQMAPQVCTAPQACGPFIDNNGVVYGTQMVDTVQPQTIQYTPCSMQQAVPQQQQQVVYDCTPQQQAEPVAAAAPSSGVVSGTSTGNMMVQQTPTGGMQITTQTPVTVSVGVETGVPSNQMQMVQGQLVGNNACVDAQQQSYIMVPQQQMQPQQQQMLCQPNQMFGQQQQQILPGQFGARQATGQNVMVAKAGDIVVDAKGRAVYQNGNGGLAKIGSVDPLGSIIVGRSSKPSKPTKRPGRHNRSRSASASYSGSSASHSKSQSNSNSSSSSSYSRSHSHSRRH